MSESGSVPKSNRLVLVSLTEGLLFYQIWLKSINNFLIYPTQRQTDRQTDTLPPQLRWRRYKYN